MKVIFPAQRRLALLGLLLMTKTPDEWDEKAREIALRVLRARDGAPIGGSIIAIGDVICQALRDAVAAERKRGSDIAIGFMNSAMNNPRHQRGALPSYCCDIAAAIRETDD